MPDRLTTPEGVDKLTRHRSQAREAAHVDG